MTRVQKLKALQELSRVKKGLDVIKSEKDYKKIQRYSLALIGIITSVEDEIDKLNEIRPGILFDEVLDGKAV